MKLRISNCCGLLMVAAALTLAPAALAESTDNTRPEVPVYRPAPLLPGMDAGAVMQTSLLRMGVQQYYRIYGKWPAAWRDVVACGLFQAQFVLPDGGEVDPDSSAPLKAGEFRYLPPTANEGGPFVQMCNLHKPEIITKDSISAPDTYAIQFHKLLNSLSGFKTLSADELEEAKAYYASLLADERRLKLLGLAGMIEWAMHEFMLARGDRPASWDEFFASGLSPVGRGAVNPATGVPLRFDGSAWDIMYGGDPASQAAHPGFTGFSHVDPDGALPPVMVLYY